MTDHGDSDSTRTTSSSRPRPPPPPQLSSPPTKTVSFASSPSTSTFSTSTASNLVDGMDTATSRTDDDDQVSRRVAPGASSRSESNITTTTSTDGQGGGRGGDTVTRPGGPKRRRSSIKQGLAMPYKPPPEHYTHPDPILRRLRLANGYGTRVDLSREFGRDVKLVLFFFAASWRGSSREPFELVENFQRRYPHQLKVVFVSIDETKRNFDLNSRSKNYLSMVWNDGSNSGAPVPARNEEDDPDRPAGGDDDGGDGDGDEPPLEPFLLAGDADLEEDTSMDPHTPASLYLRPFSRVHLTEKWHVLGVPNLVVYHVASREVLSYHARFELLKPHQLESTWDKWSRGERITFGFKDFVIALRWTLLFLVVSLVYLVAVKRGWCPNYAAMWSSSLSEKTFAVRGASAGNIEL
ncbi:hypothetical protein JCM3766R1_006698 [Sporobolomyces carnicolor]